VSTHAPPQSLKPELQRARHLPPRHSRVPFATSGQLIAQPPQFSTSLSMCTQVPPQAAVPAPEQRMPQTPFEHVGDPSPLELHTFPQVPQFDVSLSRSTQEPEHSSRPASQAEPLHVPPAHTWSSPHVVPQFPQCARLESKSMHTPLQFV
jgi:hypothetical protein